MISLKKHIDIPLEVLNATVESYRGALSAMGNCSAQACPPLSGPFQLSLVNLRNQISADMTPAAALETGKRIEKELCAWGGRAAQYYQQKTGEIKEIMMLLASAAEQAGEHNQRNAARLGGITARLQGIAGLEDITAMKKSLVMSANELKSSVEQMTREAQDSVQLLRQELAGYEKRLKEADGLAMRDELTGLDNRRGMEAKLEARVAQGRKFSLLVLDLNDFKGINDSFGHLAGDQLLKQFAKELRSAVRSTDLVARWGGDEFVVALDTADAGPQIERIKRWVCGDYVIEVGGQPRKVAIHAAIGVAVWSPQESVAEVFGRADEAMYREKPAQSRR